MNAVNAVNQARTRLFPAEDDFAAPAHDPRVTSRIGVWLGVAFGVCFVTGLLSHAIQHPPGWFAWPTRPVGLYRVTQGLHVISGVAAVPLLLAKLWTVYPRFFARPAVRSVAHALDRLSVLVLLTAAFFELATGLLNTAHAYPWRFFFPPVHYAVGWIAIGALVVHIGIKLPVIREALGESVTGGPREAAAPAIEPEPHRRARPAIEPEPHRRARPAIEPEPHRRARPAIEPEPHRRAEPAIEPDPRRRARPAVETEPRPHAGPAPPRRRAMPGLSRRGFLRLSALTTGAAVLATAGVTVPWLRRVSVLAWTSGTGPQGLPVNRTAAAAGVRADPGWTLTIAWPGGEREFGLDELTALPQRTAELPIACVEGWSASATWTGVGVRDLLEHAGAPTGHPVNVESAERDGVYNRSTLPPAHADDPLTLLALRLNGEVLELDHGYPARIIAPSRPGVLQTKWVRRLEVQA